MIVYLYGTMADCMLMFIVYLYGTMVDCMLMFIVYLYGTRADECILMFIVCTVCSIQVCWFLIQPSLQYL
jgi:hypothetical protein